MFFQSYSFLFVFLPIVVLTHELLTRAAPSAAWAQWFLVCASVYFCTSLSPGAVLFLAGTCAFNLLVARRMAHSASEADGGARRWLVIGVSTDVAVLAVFKYSKVLGLAPILGEHLPVGASFITFIQIVYLVETFNGSLRTLALPEYLKFSTFFGYITSGPVVSANEVVGRAEGSRRGIGMDAGLVLPAIALLAMGLFKKLAIADPLAPYANQAFAIAERAQALSSVDAWAGALLYMLQLYFDFSGYSDMAIAIGCLFGMRLPLNFNSPFKATNVMDYWRRWHMTLTRFITNFLYLPLAVAMNRQLRGRRAVGSAPRFLLTVAWPTVAAFVVAGIWHGNGWTFFFYGLYWGLALTLHQTWARVSPMRIPAPLAWLFTMATALGSLVIFRSPTMDTALTFLAAAVGLGASAAVQMPPWTIALAMSLLAAASILPNSQQLLSRYQLSADEVEPPAGRWRWMLWRPDAVGAIMLGIVLSLALLMGGGPTQFLYYKF